MQQEIVKNNEDWKCTSRLHDQFSRIQNGLILSRHSSYRVFHFCRRVLEVHWLLFLDAFVYVLCGKSCLECTIWIILANCERRRLRCLQLICPFRFNTLFQHKPLSSSGLQNCDEICPWIVSTVCALGAGYLSIAMILCEADCAINWTQSVWERISPAKNL